MIALVIIDAIDVMRLYRSHRRRCTVTVRTEVTVRAWLSCTVCRELCTVHRIIISVSIVTVTVTVRGQQLYRIVPFTATARSVGVTVPRSSCRSITVTVHRVRVTVIQPLSIESPVIIVIR